MRSMTFTLRAWLTYSLLATFVAVAGFHAATAVAMQGSNTTVSAQVDKNPVVAGESLLLSEPTSHCRAMHSQSRAI
ncbi:MAG: hypothetical protein M1356_08930 [Gammaproteobacteria bacterium]|nr:hypothetical protein [Gammaproteobacteria bacterium]